MAEAGHSTRRVQGLSIGSVISKTWTTLTRHPGLFFGLSFLATVPPLILRLITPNSGEPQGGRVVLMLVASVIGMVFQGAIAYGVFQAMVGRAPSMGNALSQGMARLVSIFGASILIGLGTGIGYLLLLVPGLILSCMWYVAIPACVVERKGAFASLTRSSELTNGFRWVVFGLLIVVGLASMAFTWLVAFLSALLTGSVAVGGLLGTLCNALPQAFGSVMTAIVYHDLRATKEGVTAKHLVDVFD